ncbi:MAG: hypothetical protein IJA32_08445 [Lachnospiraceae bacterium]|nr:hypothetical protein [Lachnospiraceae bacterium]
MSIHKRGFIVTVVLALSSLTIAMGLNYLCKEQFWCNVCLGIFGSSLLTAVTSIIGYYVERRRITEGFFTETLKIIKEINKYQHDLVLDDKIDFCLSLSDYDTTTLNMYYGQMDFFRNQYRKDVFERIYNPVLSVLKKASSHAWHFRMHKNGTGRNEVVMQKFVDEIESIILERTQFKYEADENQECVAIGIKNKIVEEISKELNGWYFEMMYGKKKASKVTEGQNG